MGRADRTGLKGPGRGLEGPKQLVDKGSLVDIGYKTGVLAYHLDCRELIARLQLGLAEHYMTELMSGRQADGLVMPPQRWADQRRGQRRRRRFYVDEASGIGALNGRLGVRSGAMATHYRWSRVSGNTMLARGDVLPFTGALPTDTRDDYKGRTLWAAQAKSKWGVDLVSAEGSATQAIGRVLSDWMRDAKSDQDGYVRTEERPSLAAGGLRWGKSDGTR